MGVGYAHGPNSVQELIKASSAINFWNIFMERVHVCGFASSFRRHGVSSSSTGSLFKIKINIFGWYKCKNVKQWHFYSNRRLKALKTDGTDDTSDASLDFGSLWRSVKPCDKFRLVFGTALSVNRLKLKAKELSDYQASFFKVSAGHRTNFWAAFTAEFIHYATSSRLMTLDDIFTTAMFRVFRSPA